MSVGTSAGKVILAGEHAVVFGVPALAVGIERGASATSSERHGLHSRLIIPDWRIAIDTSDRESDLARAFGTLLDEVRKYRTLARVDVEARASLPPGGGLGCSAALGVAIARSLVQDDKAVEECAMAWERVFHGNPSGIDAAVCMHGGCVRFVKGQPPLHLTIGAPLFLAVGFSGESSSTRAMVTRVAELRDQQRTLVDDAFARVHSIVDQSADAAQIGNVAALGKLLSENQNVLAALSLSTPAIDRMCDAAESAGALGSKLTGAGGGGCVIALGLDAAAAKRVLSAWESVGFSGFATEVAVSRTRHKAPALRVNG